MPKKGAVCQDFYKRKPVRCKSYTKKTPSESAALRKLVRNADKVRKCDEEKHIKAMAAEAKRSKNPIVMHNREVSRRLGALYKATKGTAGRPTYPQFVKANAAAFWRKGQPQPPLP
jgi:hypothetical protein